MNRPKVVVFTGAGIGVESGSFPQNFQYTEGNVESFLTDADSIEGAPSDV